MAYYLPQAYGCKLEKHSAVQGLELLEGVFRSGQQGLHYITLTESRQLLLSDFPLTLIDFRILRAVVQIRRMKCHPLNESRRCS